MKRGLGAAVVARAVTLSAGVALAGCGSRTQLPGCTDPGATRACFDACGPGTQMCLAGQWQPCEVPVVMRTCSNDCGSGTQSCQNQVWSACMVPVATRACTTACGNGQQRCVDGTWDACDGPQPEPPTFLAVLRDFTPAHPDFEARDGGRGLDPGMLEAQLGPDDKPVYASDASTPTTHGAFYFNEWYRDTPGPNPGQDAGPVNETTTVSLALLPSTADPTLYAYDNNFFFPVDGRLFGNEGAHNYYFTVELATTFRYTGGEVFRFSSDDDSWVFLNRRLAVDLGGVHQAIVRTISLDDFRETLGISVGQTYPMHLFFADRHIVSSVLHIDVPAADFGVCP